MDYIGISKPLKITGITPKANVDYNYGPWASVQEALTNIPLAIRAKGMTVGIVSGSDVVEYYFKSGTADANLVIKQTESSGGGSTPGEIVYTEVAGGIEDNTTYLNTTYPNVGIGSKIVDTVNNVVYEKYSEIGWIKFAAYVLASTSPQSGEIITAVIEPYK